MLLRPSLVLLLLVGFLSGCNPTANDQAETTENKLPMGKITLRIRHVWNGEPLKAGLVTKTTDGTAIRVDNARYILSNPVLLPANGKPIPMPINGSIVSAVENDGLSMVVWEGAPLGKYKGLRFHVGLDEKTNHINPVTELAETHPLFEPEMHWSWNPEAGYKFMLIEGLVDNNKDGKPNIALEYHIAEDTRYRAVELLADYALEIQDESGASITLTVDLAKAVEGVNLAANPINMSSGGAAADADRIANNFEKMFKLKP
jgi:hypothetical protein